MEVSLRTMKRTMKIKKLEGDEAGMLACLCNQHRLFYGQPSDVTGANNYINARLQSGESVVFAAFDEEGEKPSPVGFVQLYPLYSSIRMVKNWILNDLFVEAEYRSKGVGKLLVEAAMDMAKGHGAKFLQLETAADNYGAQRLYEAIGFERQSIDTKFYLYKISLD